MVSMVVIVCSLAGLGGRSAPRQRPYLLNPLGGEAGVGYECEVLSGRRFRWQV